MVTVTIRKAITAKAITVVPKAATVITVRLATVTGAITAITAITAILVMATRITAVMDIVGMAMPDMRGMDTVVTPKDIVGTMDIVATTVIADNRIKVATTVMEGIMVKQDIMGMAATGMAATAMVATGMGMATAATTPTVPTSEIYSGRRPGSRRPSHLFEDPEDV